jgi:RNA polymerase sigma-70 factor (ECF subfamily)
MCSSIRVLSSTDTQSTFVNESSYSVAADESDYRLIERIASGDRLAMHTLYIRHSVRVYRFALRLVNDETVAEDLVSDVFLDVWRKGRTFEGRSQVSTWLLAIARHKAIDAMNSRSTDPLDEETYDSIEDPSDNPEAATERNQNRAILLNCLAQLSAAHRQIIDLVYYHQKTVNEVADITGIERGTVKTRMFYARKRLAELLGKQSIAVA